MNSTRNVVFGLVGRGVQLDFKILMKILTDTTCFVRDEKTPLVIKAGKISFLPEI